VREFAVPPSMIEAATARRARGDWAGACAAARADTDIDLRAVAGAHGRDLAARLRTDLRHLAPDLLRWHLPRIAPDGLLRPGLTITLARYERDPSGAPARDAVHLVARTPPGWADGGQRFSLAVWDGGPERSAHPHPRPDRRYRLDLHRPLWDARHTADLPHRAGRPADLVGLLAGGYAVSRWAAEADLVRRADGRAGDPVTVRLHARSWLALDPGAAVPRVLPGPGQGLPVLPDAAVRVLPDLELLRAGLIDPDRLHPLVAAALVPGHPGRTRRDDPRAPRLVDCRGAQHRLALVDGVLAPLDHDRDELRREELLATLGGSPLPCLRVIAEVHRHPAGLADIRARLDHGDVGGALDVVEHLLGPQAVLRDGPLKDALATAAERRITYGLYRSGVLSRRAPYKQIDDGRRPCRRAISR